MMRKAKMIAVVGFVWLLACSVSYADEAASNGVEEWDPVSAGSVTTWTAPVCAKGELVVQPFFTYTKTRGTFDSEGNPGRLDKGDNSYQYLEQLFFQYGITDRFEIAGQTEYQHNYAEVGEAKAHARGLGDSYAFVRYCLFEEQALLPHITGIFQLTMPTGKYQKADPDKLNTDITGSGSWDHGYGLIMTKKIKPFILHADAIYNFAGARTIDAVKTDYANYLTYDFGAEYFLPKGFNLLLEFNGSSQGDIKQDGERMSATDVRSFTVAPGIGWSNDTIQTLICYQRTLSGTNTDDADAIVATVVYTF